MIDLDGLASAPREDSMFHGEVQVQVHVRQRGRKAVSQYVPKVKKPVHAVGQETWTKHNVGILVDERSRKSLMLTRVVFQIGILNRNRVARGFRDPGA